MTDAVTISAAWADTRTLQALQAALAARSQYLEHECAEKSVTATAINVLRSLRAETRTVPKRPAIFDDRYLVSLQEGGGYVAGWAAPPRNFRKGRRVLRAGAGGHAIDRVGPRRRRIINLAGPYSRGERLQVFRGYVTNLKSLGEKKPFIDVYIVAKSEADARRWLELRIERRIGQYRGISKRAIGLAMHQMAGTPESGAFGSWDIQRLLGRVVRASSSARGFGSGTAVARVDGGIPEGVSALKNGSFSFQIAMQRAVNFTVGLINKRGALPLGQKLVTPFPEVKAS